MNRDDSMEGNLLSTTANHPLSPNYQSPYSITTTTTAAAASRHHNHQQGFPHPHRAPVITEEEEYEEELNFADVNQQQQQQQQHHHDLNDFNEYLASQGGPGYLHSALQSPAGGGAGRRGEEEYLLPAGMVIGMESDELVDHLEGVIERGFDGDAREILLREGIDGKAFLNLNQQGLRMIGLKMGIIQKLLIVIDQGMTLVSSTLPPSYPIPLPDDSGVSVAQLGALGKDFLRIEGSSQSDSHFSSIAY